MNTELRKRTLEDIGYDIFFDSLWKSLELKNFSAARVIAEHKEAYKVKNLNGEYWAKVTGKQMFNAASRTDYPAVGDWVAITELDEAKAVIHQILPRKTILKKKYTGKQDAQVIAANIDIAFIMESLGRDYNLNRFERYFVLARAGGIKPVIILNKLDLAQESEVNETIEQIKNRFGNIDIFATSAVTERGLDEISNYIIRGKTYCFLGSSGVGKSSLINKLLKSDIIKIREISYSADRGKHTTTAREMYFLSNGGIVIDNPGTRGVGIYGSGEGIENVFDEIRILSTECKYADCTHMHEPGCAVLKAIEDGNLDEEKYQNYIKLKKEDAFYKMTDFERRKKDRKFGKFIKKRLEELKEIRQ